MRVWTTSDSVFVDRRRIALAISLDALMMASKCSCCFLRKVSLEIPKDDNNVTISELSVKKG